MSRGAALGSLPATASFYIGLKQAAPKLPLVVVGPNDVDAKVRLFKIGADDYVVEPFDFRELTARINSLIRRQRPGPP